MYGSSRSIDQVKFSVYSTFRKTKRNDLEILNENQVKQFLLNIRYSMMHRLYRWPYWCFIIKRLEDVWRRRSFLLSWLSSSYYKKMQNKKRTFSLKFSSLKRLLAFPLFLTHFVSKDHQLFYIYMWIFIQTLIRRLWIHSIFSSMNKISIPQYFKEDPFICVICAFFKLLTQIVAC